MQYGVIECGVVGSRATNYIPVLPTTKNIAKIQLSSPAAGRGKQRLILRENQSRDLTILRRVLDADTDASADAGFDGSSWVTMGLLVSSVSVV